MSRPSETVSFRLNSDVGKLVDRQRKPFGLSRGEWVRGLVTNNLQNNSVDQLAKEIIELRQTVRDESEALHDSIRRLAYLVLTQADPLTPDKAKDEVQKLFHRIQSEQ